MSWAYIAGFFDGEGTVTVRQGHVTIFQKEKRVLEKIQKFLAEQGVYSTLHHRQDRKHNNLGYVLAQWQLCVRRRQSVRMFLGGIRPYAIVKKQRIEDLWRFLTIYPGLPNTVTGSLSTITDKHISRVRLRAKFPGGPQR